MMGAFSLLAWLGSLIDNLLLTYLLGKSLFVFFLTACLGCFFFYDPESFFFLMDVVVVLWTMKDFCTHSLLALFRANCSPNFLFGPAEAVHVVLLSSMSWFILTMQHVAEFQVSHENSSFKLKNGYYIHRVFYLLYFWRVTLWTTLTLHSSVLFCPQLLVLLLFLDCVSMASCRRLLRRSRTKSLVCERKECSSQRRKPTSRFWSLARDISCACTNSQHFVLCAVHIFAFTFSFFLGSCCVPCLLFLLLNLFV